MADLVYLLVIVAFFALCAAYVHGCERIIRSSEETDSASGGMR